MSKYSAERPKVPCTLLEAEKSYSTPGGKRLAGRGSLVAHDPAAGARTQWSRDLDPLEIRSGPEPVGLKSESRKTCVRLEHTVRLKYPGTEATRGGLG